jgi:hypothetical protein
MPVLTGIFLIDAMPRHACTIPLPIEHELRNWKPMTASLKAHSASMSPIRQALADLALVSSSSEQMVTHREHDCQARAAVAQVVLVV